VASFEQLDYSPAVGRLRPHGHGPTGHLPGRVRRVVTYDDTPQGPCSNAHATRRPRTEPSGTYEGYEPRRDDRGHHLDLSTGYQDRGGSTNHAAAARSLRGLLPDDVIAGDQFIRKIKEILQARNLI